MKNFTFYVKDINGKLVAAKYLYYDGSAIVDPNLKTAKATPIYDSNGDLLPAQNLNGHLIVPAGYDIQEATSFAQPVSQEMISYTEFPDGEEVYGLPVALEMMALAF